MLNNCSDILEYEMLLLKKTKEIKFVGQLDLQENDVIKLGNLIKAEIAKNNEGINAIINKFSNSLAVFLVHAGIWGYQKTKGDFWSGVSKYLNIFHLRIQKSLGEFFLSFIKSRGFNCDRLSGSYRFVSQMLLHGGIPQGCLGEFMEKIVSNLIDQEITTTFEIKDQLQELRNQEKNRQIIKEQLLKLNSSKRVFLKQKRAINRWYELAGHIADLGKRIEFLKGGLDVFQLYLETETKLKALNLQSETWEKEIKDTTCKIAELEAGQRENEFQYLTIKKCLETYEMINQAEEKIREIQSSLQDQENKLSIEYKQFFGSECQPGFFNSFSQPAVDDVVILHSEIRDLKKKIDNLTGERESRLCLSPPILRRQFWLGFLLVFIGVSLVWMGDRTAAWGMVVGGLLLSGYYYKCLLRDKVHFQIQGQEREALDSKLATVKADLMQKETHFGQMFPGPLDMERILACSPAEFYEKYCNIRQELDLYCQHQSQFEAYQNDLASYYKMMQETAAGIWDKGWERDPGEIYHAAKDKLQQADDAKRKEQKLKSVLAEKQSLLDSARKEADLLSFQLNEISERISFLGDSDFTRGFQSLQNFHFLVKEKKSREREMEELMKTTLKTGEENNLEDLRFHIIQKLGQIDAAIQRAEDRLAALPEPLPWVDETVRRFLFYGSNWAEIWLVESVRLVLAGDGATEFNLPLRVVDYIKDWKQKHFNKKVRHRGGNANLEKISPPFLSFQPSKRELKIVVNSQAFSVDQLPLDRKVHIVLEITGQEEAQSWQRKIYLNAIKGNGCQIITEREEISITRLFPEYRLSLKVGEEIITSWVLFVFSKEQPWMLFADNGKQAENIPPGVNFWIGLPAGLNLTDNRLVIEEVEVPQLRYCFVRINGTRMACQSLSVKWPGCRGEILLDPKGSAGVAPDLIGGKISPLVSVGDRSLYIEEMPQLRVPGNGQEFLDGWVLAVMNNLTGIGDGLKFNLGQMPMERVYSKDNFWHIPLSLLLDQSLPGSFKLRLRSPLGDSFVFYLDYLPVLITDFFQDLYFPSYESNDIVDLDLITGENVQFLVEAPARLLEKNEDVYSIQVPAHEDAIEGRFVFSREEPLREPLPVSIAIPKIRWKIGDESWQDQIQEIPWKEWPYPDNMPMQVYVPGDSGVFAQFILGEGEQKKTVRLENKRAVINLLEFGDTLAKGLPVLPLNMKVFTSRGKLLGQGTLLKLRSRWEVMQADWQVERDDKNLNIGFSWQESHQTAGRMIRLWFKDEPWRKPLEFFIPDTECQLMVTIPKDQLPSGNYLVEFLEHDPWTEEEPRGFPGEKKNSFLMELNNGDPSLTIDSVRESPRGLSIKGRSTNMMPDQKFSMILLGMADGRFITYETRLVLDEQGKWNFFLPHGPGTSLPGRYSTKAANWHWCIVFLDQNFTRSRVVALPPIKPLECAWSYIADPGIWDHLPTLNFRLKIKNSQLQRTINTPLTPESGQRVLQLWQKGLTGSATKISVQGYDDSIYFTCNENGDVEISLENGVICLSCGKVLPSQSAWYEHTHEKKYRGCKSFQARVKQVEAELIATFGFMEAFPVIKERNLYPMIMFKEDESFPLADFRENSKEKKKEILRKLLKRELSILNWWGGKSGYDI